MAASSHSRDRVPRPLCALSFNFHVGAARGALLFIPFYRREDRNTNRG